jgi:predicted anti-sigma-YlaC factor YlaD
MRLFASFASCKEAARNVAEALEHELPLGRRLALRFHLLICSACRRYRRQVVGLNRLVQRYVRESSQPIAVLSPATRQRFVEAMRKAAMTPPSGTPGMAGGTPSGVDPGGTPGPG